MLSGIRLKENEVKRLKEGTILSDTVHVHVHVPVPVRARARARARAPVPLLLTLHFPFHVITQVRVG
jgi:hypothetical protein